MGAATHAPTIAIAAAGDPRSPATWSGTTAGLIDAFEAMGFGIVPVDVSLPRRLEHALLAAAALPTRNRFDAEGAALTAVIRTARARRALAGTDAAGVIQIGTTFALPASARYVTLEDMTVHQAREVHPVFSRMSDAGARAWERRRGGIYADARMCTAGSRWTSASLRDDYGIADERIAIVGFGANHRPQPTAREWGSPRFLFVGLDWERKGGPMLLRAFARVREAVTTATLDVVGGHPPLQQESVRFHGVLSHQRERDSELVRELFGAATCFVMPSSVEPFGIAYVEAAAAGIPSIGTTVGGASDIIGADGGAVVAPGDEDALVRAMLDLADPARARRAGEAALERSALYTWPAVAERMLRALDVPAPDGREPAAFL